MTSVALSVPRPFLALDGVLLCGRHLRLMVRRPASLAEVIVLPLAFTLLFFTVFQRTMVRAGIDYAQYLIPAVIVQAVFFTALSTAVHAAEDAQGGLLQRLRCLSVARAAPSAGLLLAELSASSSRWPCSYRSGWFSGSDSIMRRSEPEA